MPLKKKSKKSGSATGVKKKKLSAAEKALNKLEKECDKFKKSDNYWPFVIRTHDWLIENSTHLIHLMSQVCPSEDQTVDHGTFRSCVLDRLIPCNKIEIHLLIQAYDPENTGQILYANVKHGLQCLRGRDNIVPKSLRSAGFKVYNKDSQADKFSYIEQYPQYIEITFKSIAFEKVIDHPMHFILVVPTHETTFEIINRVLKRTKINTSLLYLFLDKDRSMKLPIYKTLEEQGFKGGPEENPKELLLYYDYRTDFWECPLLMCDHYFGKDQLRKIEPPSVTQTEDDLTVPQMTSAELYYS